MFPDQTLALAQRVISTYASQKLMLATVESCTGGLIAGCLTAISGASEVLSHGFVTYSNEAKAMLVGVPEEKLSEHGAVSEAVARCMAEGAIISKDADVAVSVTGIAGPGGGSPEKPVGLVHISVARKGTQTMHERHVFAGDRQQVRLQSIDAALQMLLKAVT